MNTIHAKNAVSRNFFVVLSLASLIGLSFSHAQETATPPQTDSIVQITAEAQGLSLVTLDQVPRTGTFWLVSPDSGRVAVPLPCPPLDPSLPIYAIADGQFLVDGTVGSQAASSTSAAVLEAQANTVLNLIARVQTTAANQQLRAMGMDVPLPGGGGGGGGDGTNGFYSDSFNFNTASYGTNLWLEINGITNQLVYITAHNVIEGYFQLLFKTNLLETDWTVDPDDDNITEAAAELKLWEPGSGWWPVPELDSGASNFQTFFWARQLNTEVGVSGGGDVIRPSPGFAPDPAIFTITRSFWPLDDPSINSDLVVHFSLSGTATNSVDFVLRDPVTRVIFTNSVTIPAGLDNAYIELDPTTNLLCLSNLTVSLTLEGDPNYLADSHHPAASATIDFNEFCLIATMPNPCGMDYHPPTNRSSSPALTLATGVSSALMPTAL